MSASLNRVTLIGNLGADPELKSAGSTSVCNLSIATSYKPKDKEEITEWHRVTVFGKTAENCAKYLQKGRSVYVDGRLQTRSYEKDGIKRYSTDIVATDVKFLGGPKGEARGNPDAGADGASGPVVDDDFPT